MALIESVNTINSSVRTLLALVLVGGLGYAGWQGYQVYDSERVAASKAAQELIAAKADLEETQTLLATTEKDLEARIVEIEQKDLKISDLNKDVAAKAKEIDRLGTALRLLKVDHRVARLKVLDQTKGEDGKLTSLIEFQEITPTGDPAGEAKQFTIKGDMVYIDNWVVKFDDEFVEKAAIERSTSLVLFRRIFGEYQEPRTGFILDTIGAQPHIYSRGGKPSELEQEIWRDFWTIANDEERAKELGIRAAHGEAVSIKVQKGKSYRVTLRASDGLSIQPESSRRVDKPSA